MKNRYSREIRNQEPRNRKLSKNNMILETFTQHEQVEIEFYSSSSRTV